MSRMSRKWARGIVSMCLGLAPLSYALEISTTDMPSGLEMVTYSASLEATNGIAPYRWSVMPNLVAWGDIVGGYEVPTGLDDVVAIAKGYSDSLALRSDGTVVTWGWGSQTVEPLGLIDVVAITAGASHSLALKSDGTVIAWGYIYDDRRTVQATVLPGLSDVVAIAGGWSHSLALKSDGTVVAWGYNGDGQTNVPPGLSDVVAIAGGWNHSLALKSDGTVVAWGYNGNGQATVPPGLSNVVAIAGGGWHSLALKSDGTVVAWGRDWDEQTRVPLGLSNVVVIAGGRDHSLALKSDGTVVAWGNNDFRQTFVPPGLSNVVAIAAGDYGNLVLRSKYSVLPDGLSCSQNGIVSGTPTLAGTNVVTFIVRDSVGTTVNKPLSVVISANANNRPVISSNTPSAGAFSLTEGGKSQTFELQAHDPEGRELTYFWTWDGFAVGGNASSYTHTTAWGGVGLHALRCYVSDDLWTNVVFSQWNVIVEDLPLEITTPSLPTGMEMVPYRADLQATNGIIPYTWSVMPPVVEWGRMFSYGNAKVSSGLDDVVAIAACYGHSLALKSDGTVVEWFMFDDPFVPGFADVVAIAAGSYHSLALRSDGTVVAWGDNGYGQANVPPELADVVAIAGGLYHSLALKSDGTVVAWGYNGNGQATVPPGLSSVVAIAGGQDHSLALKSDGTVVAWGNYGYGQADVPSGLADVVAIAAGYNHSLALKSDGTVVAWGDGLFGQADVPSELADVVAIAAGDEYSLALRRKDTSLPQGLSCSTNGIVSGTPTLAGTNVVTFIVRDSVGTTVNKPLSVVISANANNRPVISSNTPSAGAFSLTEGGKSQIFELQAHDPEGRELTYFWTWDGVPVGGNVSSYTHTTAWGGVGLHALRCYVSDELWTNVVFSQWNVIVEDLPLAITTPSLPAGMEMMPYSAVLEATNGIAPYTWSIPILVAWGGNYYGQATVPVGLSDLVAIAAGRQYSLALKSDGTVVGLGPNGYGPADVPPGLVDVVAIAVGEENSLALKSDGTVVAWGYNGYGQADVPSGLSNVVAIAAGSRHSLALKADGTVVAWGYSGYGQTTVPPGLSDVVAIAAGYNHSLALKSDGTVVAWGNDPYNVPPPGLADVVVIAGGAYHSLALKSDGTVVAWGDDGSGQTTVPPGLSSVVAIAGGWNHSLALKSDGTVVAWGGDWRGQAEVPQELTGVVAIAAGDNFSLALLGKSAMLPEGLSCSTNGLLSGMPTRAGTNLVTFVVQDSVGTTTNKTFDITIAPNPNLRPVISSNAPPAGAVSMGEATNQFFRTWASDPEGGPLTYAWTWDGVAVGGNGSSYTHTTAWGDAGLHTLRCYVSDDFWTNRVFAQWNVTVLDDNDGDGMPNMQEIDLGRDPNDAGDAGGPSSLSGIVKGRGVGLAGATVELRGIGAVAVSRTVVDSAGTYLDSRGSGGTVYHRAVTDGSGAYALTNVPPGRYFIKVCAVGFADEWHQDANQRVRASINAVPAAATITGLDFYLESGQSPALVNVTSEPAGAVVYVDSQSTGLVTPACVDIGEAGRHTLTVKKQGLPWPSPLRVLAVEAETIDAHFDLSSGQPGSLSVRTTPAGATVYVDYADEQVGLSPIVVANLLPGWHRILLKKEGFLQPMSVSAWVDSGSNRTVQVAITPRGSGSNLTVHVVSDPPGASIYVNSLLTTNVTDAVIDWLDAAYQTGSGWFSVQHVISLGSFGYLPSALRLVDISTVEQTIAVPLQRARGALSCNIQTDARNGMPPFSAVFSALVSGTNTASLYFLWDLDNDGRVDMEGAGLATVTNVFDRCGLYTVSVTVNNAAGETVTAVAKNCLKLGPATAYVSPTGGNVFPYTDWVTAATDIETAVRAGVDGTLVLVAEGRYQLSRPIELRDGIEVLSVAGADQTIVDGNGKGRCFTLDHPNAFLDGFTLTGGNAEEGGGVFCSGGAVVQNCNIVSNTAFWGGGAICSEGSAIRNCVIQDNWAVRGGGGARCWEGGRIENSLLSGNVAGWGGGILCASSGVVRRCVIVSNSATNGVNGGDGGGIYFDFGGLMDRCVLSSNFAANGGGVMCGEMGATIRNSVISQNVAVQDGGGVMFAGNTMFANCTVYGNTAGQSGGGVFSGNGAEVQNTILYFNTAPAGANFYNSGTGGVYSFCCATPVPAGIGNLGLAPGFVDAAAGDYRLGASSPCVNSGTNAVWMAGAVDLLGTNRIMHGRVDIGAYESSEPLPAGSRILRHLPSGNVEAPIRTVRFDFSYAMDQTSFDPVADIISFAGPGGAIVVTGYTWVNESTLELRFAEQTQSGVYQLIIAPGMTDMAGREMDQNSNGTAGEPVEDRYVAVFSMPSFWVSGCSPSGDQVYPVSSLTVRFNKAVKDTSFTATDVAISGPGGSISLTGEPTRLSPSEYQLVFPTQRIPGDYHVLVGPNIVSEDGAPLDQDGDGVAGEPVGDVCDAGFTIIDVAGPKVLSNTPVRSSGAVSQLDICFNEPMRAASFDLSDISITGPRGTLISCVSVTNTASDSFRVFFQVQTQEGTYRVIVGPNISDAAGNLMNQDGDPRNGEPFDDCYRSEFIIDRSGPWVVQNSVGGATQNVTVSSVEFTFSEPMSSATVTTNVFTMAGAGGTNTALSVTRLTSQTYLVTFRPCPSNGVFTVCVAPLPTDTVGNSMDQDRDGIGGEINDDRYIFEFVQRLPDLSATRVSGPEEAEGGQETEVSWTVANRGLGAATGGWRDAVYLSEDGTWDSGDIPLGVLAFSEAVESGASYSRVMTVTLPPLSGVRRWLIAVADVSNKLAEAETVLPYNNVAVSAVPVWFVNRLAPDLQVTEVVAPAKLHPGEKARISWTVRNSGTQATSGLWYDRVYLSTTTNLNATTAVRLQPDVRNKDLLSPGEAYTQTLDFDIPSSVQGGTYYVIVETDAGKHVNEFGNEGNNLGVSSAAPVQVETASPAVLEVTSVVVPASVAVGSSPTFTWTVRNSGGTTIRTGWAGSGWDDALALSRDPVYDEGDYWLGSHSYWRGCPLAPGASYTKRGTPVHAIPQWAPGTYYLIVIPDTHFGADAEIGKSVVERNYGVVPITIAESPAWQQCDLTPTNVVAPTAGTAGQTVRVSWSILNKGPGASCGDRWTDRLALSANRTWDAGVIPLGQHEHYGTLAANAAYEVTDASFTLPGDLAGDYYVLLQTDSGESVYESNETNNILVSSQKISIQRYDTDLTVQSAAATNQAVAGEAISVRWTVTNRGVDGTTGSGWSDTLYLSASDTLVVSDAYRLGVFTHSGTLNAAEAYTNTSAMVLPAKIEGTYRLFVVCDSGNAVFERNAESNNEYRIAQPIVIANLAPDLAIIGAGGPSNAVAGSGIAVWWSVTNAGSRVASAPWTDSVYLSADDRMDTVADNTLLASWVRTNDLVVGDSYIVSNGTVNVRIPDRLEGAYHLFIVTDSGGAIYEKGSESNNSNLVSHSVMITDLAPDLEIQHATAPTNGVAGDLVRIEWSTVNRGAEGVTNRWKDAVYLSANASFSPTDDTLCGVFEHPGPLDSGQTSAPPSQATWMRLPARIEGDYYVFVVADYENAVYEKDGEDNNVFFIPTPIHIMNRPADLQVACVEAPVEAMAGSMIPVTWSVANRGGKPTDESFWQDGIYLSKDNIFEPASDIELGIVPHNGGLPVDGVYTQMQAFVLRQDIDGPYHIYAVADVRRQVYEYNREDNNITAATSTVVVVGLRTDLSVTGLSAPGTATVGAPVRIEWTVKNNGVDASVVDTWADTVYLSSDAVLDSGDIVLIESRHSGVLGAGATYNAVATVVLPATVPGSYRLIVKTDSSPFNDVFEYDAEDNNTGSTAIQIGLAPPPDLQVTAVTLPSAVWSGQDLLVRWTVANEGDAEAMPKFGKWFDNVYLSRDPYLDIGQDRSLGSLEYTGPLGRKMRYSREFAARLPYSLSGPFYVLVFADSTDHVAERGLEQNNVGVSSSNVQINLTPPSDLQVTALTGSTNSVIYGELTNFVFEVSNLGSQPAVGVWHDTLYLSADNQWDIDDARIARIRHSGDVAAGSNYVCQVLTNMPAVLPGEYYLIAKADILDDVRETSEANNTLVSTNTLTVIGRELAFVEAQSNLLSKGQSRYYQIDTASGDDLVVALRGAAAAGAELYLAHGRIPTRSDYDFLGETDDAGRLLVRIPGAYEGTYYILVYGAGSSPSAGFDILASLTDYAITEISLSEAGNAGSATFTIDGYQFTPGMTIRLEDAEHHVVATGTTLFGNSGSLAATLNLRGVPPGTYNLVLESPGGAQQTTPFNVTAGKGGELFGRLLIPSFVRVGRTYTFTLEYGNSGDADIPAPLFAVSTGPGATIRLRPEDAFGTTPIQVMGLADGNPAGILPPHSTYRLDMEFQLSVSDYVPFYLKTIETTNDETLDLEAIANQVEPSGMDTDSWQSFIGNLLTRMAPTWGSYASVLGTDATRLARRGQRTFDVRDLFKFEVALAQGNGSGAIAGRVAEIGNGESVLDAAIFAFATDGRYGSQSTIREDGTFVIDGLSAGEYLLEIEGFIIRTGSSALVTAEEDCLNHIIEVIPAAKISGYVTTVNGLPVTNALMVANGASGTGPFVAMTDGQGHYQVTGLQQGNYVLTVNVNNTLEYARTAVALSAGEVRDDINFRLDTGCRLTGRVVDALNGTAISGATIRASAASGPSATAISGGDGYYVLTGLSAGYWDVSVAAERYVASQAVNSELQFAKTSNLDFVLVPGASITGKILDANGNPVVGAVVSAIGAGGASGAAVTDEQGDYEITGLENGDYEIVVRAQGYVPIQLTLTNVLPTTSTSISNLQLAEGVRVTGTVVDETSGVGIAGASVFFQSNSGIDINLTTDATGSFDDSQFAPGVYALRIGASSHCSLVRMVEVPSIGSLPGLDIVLPSGINISGVVTRSDGMTAMPEALVSVCTVEGTILASTSTKDNGGYNLDAIPPGYYTLIAYHSDYSFASEQIEATNNFDIVANFAAAVGGVTGTVMATSTGLPLTNAIVKAIPLEKDAGWKVRAVIVTNGNYMLSSLAAGDYTIVCEAGTYGRQLQQITVKDAVECQNFTLPDSLTCTGRVMAAGSGLPIAGATVWMASRGAVTNDPGVSTVSDGDGYYAISGLSSDSYIVWASAEGYSTTQFNLTVSGSVYQDCILGTNGFAVTGTVIDETTRLPIARASVMMIQCGVVVSQAISDNLGAFKFQPISIGDYRLVSMSQGTMSSMFITILNDTNVTMAFLLGVLPSIGESLSGQGYNQLKGQLAVNQRGDRSEIRSTSWWPYGPIGFLAWMPESYRKLFEPAKRLPEDLWNTPIPSVPESCASCSEISLGLKSAIQLSDIWFMQWETERKYLQGLVWRDGALVFARGIQTLMDGASTVISALTVLVPRPVPGGAPGMEPEDANQFVKMLAAKERVRRIWLLCVQISKLEVDLQVQVASKSDKAISIGHDINKLLGTTSSLLKESWPLFETVGKYSGVGSLLINFYNYVDHLNKTTEEWTIRAIALVKTGYTEERMKATYEQRVRDSVIYKALLDACLAECGGEQPPPPPPPGGGGGDGTTGGGSHDPNDKLVDVGVGENRCITPDQSLGYTIRFENATNATASAQLVTVTDPLDASLDWSTFELGDFNFGSNTVVVPPGLKYYSTRVDLRPQGNELLVDIEAKLDPATGVATWIFSAIDPATGEFTEDFWDGFLPPNDTIHSGEGFVKFRIKPKAGLSNSTVIPNVATIVFDWNEPIDTPLVCVTIDSLAPSSRVNALPQECTSDFVVSWFGSDGTNGSGIASYDVYVSKDSGPFTPWLERTTAMSAQFSGEANALYAFYTIARDQVGHTEAAPLVPDTATHTTVAATLADADGDGMLDDWEREHFGSTLRADALSDRDRDGIFDRQEYLNGTDPTDPASGAVQFSVDSCSVSENSGAAVLTVYGGRTNGTSSVAYWIIPGTATSGLDYTPPATMPRRIAWTNALGDKTITIPIKTDALSEDDETFYVLLGSPMNCVIGEPNVCKVTITNASRGDTLADALDNTLLTWTTGGTPAWVAQGAVTSDGEDAAASGAMASNKVSYVSTSVTGTGTLSFAWSVAGRGTLRLLDGTKVLAAVTNTTAWQTRTLKLTNNVAHVLKWEFTQGSRTNGRAYLDQVVWLPGNKSGVAVTAISSNPLGGLATGTGVYYAGVKVPLNVKPRPGWLFTGWTPANLFAKPLTALQTLTVSNSAISVTANFAKVPVVTGLSNPPEGGTVSGSGLCLPGKSVTLKATPSAKWAFTSWSDGSMMASRVVSATADVTLYAGFKSISQIAVPIITNPGSQIAMVGVPFRLALQVASECLPTVTVIGLPAGLTFDAGTRTISGVPKAVPAGGWVKAKISASNPAGKAVDVPFTITVAPLAAKAQGTFTGIAIEPGADSDTVKGLFTMTVTPVGAISAKVTEQANAISFAGKSWDTLSNGVFQALLRTVKGEALTMALDTGVAWNAAGLQGTLTGGVFGASALAVRGQRNAFLVKTAPDYATATNTLAGYKGYYTVALPPGDVSDAGAAGNAPQGSGYLALTVKDGGAVTLAGKLADDMALSGSATLFVQDNGVAGVCAYVPLFFPLYSARGVFSGLMELGSPTGTAPSNNVVKPVESIVQAWRYPGKAPTAVPPQTEDRFALTLGMSGGYYNSLQDLRAHYSNGWFAAQVSGVTNTYTSGSYTTKVGVVHGTLPDVQLAFNPATGAISLPLGKAPVYTAGTYVYAPTNPATATLAVTKATGLFTGKFNLYYEYIDQARALKLKTVPITHAGVLTPMRLDAAMPSGQGYYLVPDTWKSTGVPAFLYPLNRSYEVEVKFEER